MIWVIGCNGMLGTEICRQLKENKIEYCGTDREVDFTSYEEIFSFAKDKKIDFIVNCAAFTAVDLAEANVEAAEKLNAKGPENLSKLCNEIGAALIHISTDYVFSGNGNAPYTEDMQVEPIGVYGVTKAHGEKAVTGVCQRYYILRTAWLYGWAGKNFVYTMLRAMNSHEAVKVVNDQRGTPTFAGDLAGVIIKIISGKKIPYGIYHCTDLGEITWWDFTNEIKKQGFETGWINEKGKACVVNPCTTSEYPTPAKRPAYSVLCKDKLQKALEITLPDWKTSLKVFLSSPLFDKSRIE